MPGGAESRSKRASAPEWYAKGLRFECTACGQCCTGAPGYVSVSVEECEGLADLLGLSLEAFLDRYTHETSAGRSLNEVRTPEGKHDCVFLEWDAQGRGLCAVYERRPLQCRTFPWWPENLRSEAAWTRVAKGCEGVGRGNIVPIEHIRIERDRQIADTGDAGGPAR